MQIPSNLNLLLPDTRNRYESNLDFELRKWIRKVAELLNGGIKFDDNFNAEIASVADTGVADTEFSYTHSLKRVPAGFIVINISKGGVVYDSGTAWTATTIYLKCTQASTVVKLLIF